MDWKGSASMRFQPKNSLKGEADAISTCLLPDVDSLLQVWAALQACGGGRGSGQLAGQGEMDLGETCKEVIAKIWHTVTTLLLILFSGIETKSSNVGRMMRGTVSRWRWNTTLNIWRCTIRKRHFCTYIFVRQTTDDDSPLYIFDSGYGDHARWSSLKGERQSIICGMNLEKSTRRKKLLEDYELPLYFRWSSSFAF